jgi:hypothetical protein
MPRLRKYNEALAQRICLRVSSGTALVVAAKEAGINPSTWYDWLREEPNLARQYQIAQTDFAHSIFHSAIEISDEAVADGAQAKRQATRVQARQYAAGKLLPKV